VTYRVRIEGADFSAERTLVSLPPRSAAEFEVRTRKGDAGEKW
jgi:hypothetical protein